MANNVKLTKAQERAAKTIDTSVAILAGAGSGKTAVLIERIKNIVLSKKASFSEIVAITFTEKAAGELVYRLADAIPAHLRAEVDQATVTTIDGYCNKILKEDAPLLGISPEFDVLEEHSARILTHRMVMHYLKKKMSESDDDIQNLIEEVDFRYAISSLEDLIDKRWQTYQWKNIDYGECQLGIASASGLAMTAPSLSHCERSEKSKQSPRESRIYNTLLMAFHEITHLIKEEKRRLGFLDFMDLEIETLNLLSQHKEVQNKQTSRVKHLLIDEFQDTSFLQTEIIQKIYQPGRNILCIVGDPGQSIYRFREANPEGIKKITKSITDNGGECIELTDNFRSGEPILTFVNTLFHPHECHCEEPERRSNPSDNFFLPLTSSVDETTPARVLKLPLSDEKLPLSQLRREEAGRIATWILNETKTNQRTYGDIAILFRSFSDIKIYEDALRHQEIPSYRSGGRTLLVQPEVKDILLCLKTLLDPDNETLAYGLARSSIIGLSDDECYQLFKKKEDKSLFTYLLEDNRFHFLKKILEFKDHISIAELILEIANRSHLFIIHNTLHQSAQPTANIEKLISLAERMADQHDYDLTEFVDYIENLKTHSIGINEPPTFGPHDNAVKLLTVHAAKGLEFPVVILADLSRADRHYALPYIIDKDQIGFKLPKDSNPLSDKVATKTFSDILEKEKEQEALERERLLYVAMTRAKELLLIPFAAKQSNTSIWMKALTPHLTELESIHADIPNITQEETLHISPNKIDHHETGSSPMTLVVSQLESYHRCPQEYYLKYVLRLPAERIERPSKKMGANTIGNIVHKCIYLTSQSKMMDTNTLVHAICREYGYNKPESGDLKKITQHLNTYTASPFFDKNLDDPQHEIPFLFQMDETSIRGTIDCIYKDGDAYSILDFKTDDVRSVSDIKKKTEEYSLQTMTYALAARKVLGNDIKKMTLLFLHTGEVQEIRLSDAHFEEGRQVIENIIHSIRENCYTISNTKTPCMRCPYHHNQMCWLDNTL